MPSEQTDRDSPEHLTEAAQAIDGLRAQRHQELPRSERAVQHFIGRIAAPRTIVAVAFLIVLWVAADVLMRAQGRAFDDRAFSILNTIATLVSLLLVIAVLSAQRTQTNLEQERARLMLQLMLIQDRKITRALNAVEDLHRVDPRVDSPEAHGALHEETDLHEAAKALQEVEAEE